MSTSLCNDTITLILSYGDLSILAVGLYIDKSFNEAANILIDKYLDDNKMTKDIIKIICCQDDSIPIIAIKRRPVGYNHMAHFIKDVDDIEYSYIMYDGRVSLLVNYTSGNAVYVMCRNDYVIFHKNNIAELVSPNEMPNKAICCIYNETLYVAYTSYTLYI